MVELYVQKARANKKTVKTFCDRARELQDTLTSFKAKIEDKINYSDHDLGDDIRVKLKNSSDLQARIERLAR